MAKKQDKSSKTAHVLNLLTSPAERAQKAATAAETPAGADGAAAETGDNSEIAEAGEVNQQAAQVRQPLIPPILQVAHHHDETLAEQIRDALEQELEPAPPVPAAKSPEPAQISEPEPAPQPEPVQTPVSEPAPQPVQAQTPVPEPAPQPAQAQTPVPEPAPEPAQVQTPMPEPMPEQVQPPMQTPGPIHPAAATQPPAPQPIVPAKPEPQFKLPESAIVSSFTMPDPPPLPPLQEELQYVNVMQKLVENMAPEYIEKFGLCKCQRCLEDVKALALTNLGPKYTVFPASERVPILTVYERRYNSLVAAELTKACTIVKQNPRHS